MSEEFWGINTCDGLIHRDDFICPHGLGKCPAPKQCPLDCFKCGQTAALTSLLDYLKERKKLNSKFVSIYHDDAACVAFPPAILKDCIYWEESETGGKCTFSDDEDQCWMQDEIASERKVLGEIGVIEAKIEELARGDT